MKREKIKRTTFEGSTVLADVAAQAFRAPTGKISLSKLETAVRQALTQTTAYKINQLFQEINFPGNEAHLQAFSKAFWDSITSRHTENIVKNATAFWNSHLNGPRHKDLLTMMMTPEGSKSYWTDFYQNAFVFADKRERDALLEKVIEHFVQDSCLDRDYMLGFVKRFYGDVEEFEARKDLKQNTFRFWRPKQSNGAITPASRPRVPK